MNSTIKNSVQLIGNIGTDVQLTNFETGTKRVSFSLATNDYYTDNSGEKVKKTEWHNLVAWGKTAELLNQNTAKGGEIAILGKLTTRNYTDKTGQTRYVTEVIVNEFYNISRTAKGKSDAE